MVQLPPGVSRTYNNPARRQRTHPTSDTEGIVFTAEPSKSNIYELVEAWLKINSNSKPFTTIIIINYSQKRRLKICAYLSGFYSILIILLKKVQRCARKKRNSGFSMHVIRPEDTFLNKLLVIGCEFFFKPLFLEFEVKNSIF